MTPRQIHAQHAARQYRMHVAAASIQQQPLVIVSPHTLQAIFTAPFAYQFIALVTGHVPTSNDPLEWSVVGGALPTGMQLSQSGLLYGDSAIGTTFSFRLRCTLTPQGLTSEQTFVEADFTLNVVSVPTQDPVQILTTSPISDGVTGQLYVFQFAAYGGVAALSWSKTVGTIPPGLTLETTGLLHGIPTLGGSYSFTVQVTDGTTTDTIACTMSVGNFNSGQGGTTPEGQIYVTTQSPLPPAQQGASYVLALQSVGESGPVTWSISSGALPAGLTMSTNGFIQGTPSESGPFTITVLASHDGDSPGSKVLTLLVTPSPPQITISAPATGSNIVAGTTFSIAWHAANIVATPTFALYALSNGVIAGVLPVTVNDLGGGDFSASVALPASAPAGAGYQIAVQDTVSQAFAVTGLFTIAPYPPVVITEAGGALTNAVKNTPYSLQFHSTGGVGTVSWTIVAGTLPTGVTLSSAGLLAGTPTVAGPSTFTVRASDGIGPPTDLPCSLAVTTPAAIVIATASPLPSAIQGAAYTPVQLAATGNVASITWSVTAGSLPTGMSLSSGGLLTGTPSAAGTSTFTVTAHDGTATDGTKQFTIQVNAVLAPGTVSWGLADGTVLTVAPGADSDVTNGFTGATGITVSQTVNLASSSVNAPAGAAGYHVKCWQRANGTICFWVRNKGIRDRMGSAQTTNEGQPIYHLSCGANMPGRTVLFGDRRGFTQVGDIWTLIRPNDPKHPTMDVSLNIVGGRYSFSRDYHMLDGGESFYVEFVPVGNQTQTDIQPGSTERTNALALLNPNETRIAAFPVLQKFLDVHKHDPTNFDNPSAPQGSRSITWLSRVENITTSGGTTFFTPSGSPWLYLNPNVFKTWYGGMTLFAPLDSVYPRPFINRTILHMVTHSLRNPSDTDTLQWARAFAHHKIEIGLVASDSASPHKGRWVTEGVASVLQPTGPYPMQVRKSGQNGAGYWDRYWKSFWEEIVALALLFPQDELLQDAVARGAAHHLAQTFTVWTAICANGNLRGYGNFLLACWSFYRYFQITGDTANRDAIKAKAEQVIELMMSTIMANGTTNHPLWPIGTNSGTTPAQGGADGWLRALEAWQIAVTKFIADAGTNPTRFAHWKNMMQWQLRYCTAVSTIPAYDGSGLRRVNAYAFHPNMSGGESTWNGAPDQIQFASSGTSSPDFGNGMYGSWLAAMHPYMVAWFGSGSDAVTGITWDEFFAQMGRYDWKWTEGNGSHLDPNVVDVCYGGIGNFNSTSFPGKIVTEGSFGAYDF